MENIVRKREIARNKEFLFFSQCFPPYMALIFRFKCTLKCRLQFVSIWTSLKFSRLVWIKAHDRLVKGLTHSHTMTPFDAPGNKPFENTVGKEEIAHNANKLFLLFPQCFLLV